MTYEDAAFAAERRHDPDPHPPLGIPERRHCSDEECMKARTSWYEDTLLPKVQNMFWKGVMATIFACMGGLFFIVSSLIDRHTLEVERAFEGRFVTVEDHKDDIARLEESFRQLGSSLTHSVDRVIQNQQTIMSAIEKRK